jgi:hypothetical protein
LKWAQMVLSSSRLVVIILPSSVARNLSPDEPFLAIQRSMTIWSGYFSGSNAS